MQFPPLPDSEIHVAPVDDQVGRTVTGNWPFLGPDNFVAVYHTYTRELVQKLVDADADVAAAVNAAQGAQAAAQDAQEAAATITSTPWQGPVWQNNWMDYDTVLFDAVRFRRHMDMLQFRGLMTRSSGSSGAAFILPADHRPTKRHVVVVWAHLGVARVDIHPSGLVDVNAFAASGGVAFVSLSGVTIPLT